MDVVSYSDAHSRFPTTDFHLALDFADFFLQCAEGCVGFLCGVCGTTPINPQLVQSIKGIIGDFLPYIIAIGSSLNINLDNVYRVSQPTEK